MNTIKNTRRNIMGIDALAIQDKLYGDDLFFDSLEPELKKYPESKLKPNMSSSFKQKPDPLKKESQSKQRPDFNGTSNPVKLKEKSPSAVPSFWDKNKVWLQPVGIGLLSLGLFYVTKREATPSPHVTLNKPDKPIIKTKKTSQHLNGLDESQSRFISRAERMARKERVLDYLKTLNTKQPHKANMINISISNILRRKKQSLGEASLHQTTINEEQNKELNPYLQQILAKQKERLEKGSLTTSNTDLETNTNAGISQAQQHSVKKNQSKPDLSADKTENVNAEPKTNAVPPVTSKTKANNTAFIKELIYKELNNLGYNGKLKSIVPHIANYQNAKEKQSLKDTRQKMNEEEDDEFELSMSELDAIERGLMNMVANPDNETR